MRLRTFFYSIALSLLPLQSSFAGNLKDLYGNTETSNCNLDTATHIAIEKSAKYGKIKEVRFCINSGQVQRLNIYKSKSGDKYDLSVRKIAKLGQQVEIRGKLSNTGKQLSPDKKRQYELENNNLVIYECIKKECKKNIITKKVIAKPIER